MKEILVMDSDKSTRRLLSDFLTERGYSVRLSTSYGDCQDLMQKLPPAAVLLGMDRYDLLRDALEVVDSAGEIGGGVPVVVIPARERPSFSASAMKKGVFDVIERPLGNRQLERLHMVMERALEAESMLRRNSELARENLALKMRQASMGTIIGESRLCLEHRKTLDRIVKSRYGGSVLLTGPPGSGKETAARYMHLRSSRAERPFIAVNTRSIKPRQILRELCGAETRGGRVTKGLAECADGGVLYIDEVSRLPRETQLWLAYLIGSQRVKRIGAEREVKVNVWVISGTTKDLEEEVKAQRFPRETFSRISVRRIKVPPLERRSEDIPLLARHFLAELNSERGLPLKTIGSHEAALLQTMDWPGNISQLRNCIERILIVGSDPERVTRSDLERAEALGGSRILDPHMLELNLEDARRDFERKYLRAQMLRFEGRKLKAAEAADLDRTTFYRKLKLGETGREGGENGSAGSAEARGPKPRGMARPLEADEAREARLQEAGAGKAPPRAKAKGARKPGPGKAQPAPSKAKPTPSKAKSTPGKAKPTPSKAKPARKRNR